MLRKISKNTNIMTCDSCSKEWEVGRDSMQFNSLMKQAHIMGWRYVKRDKKHFCPTCVSLFSKAA